jgi:hypothetical protein
VRVAQLFGAAEALRAVLGAPLPPVQRADYDRAAAAARALIGEDSFTQAMTAGRAMTLEQAIDIALDEKI